LNHQVSLPAAADLRDVWFYVAVERQSPEAADQFIDRLNDQFLLLSQFSHIGRRRDDLHPGYRSFRVGQYIIFYRILEAGEVEIMRVLHGKRDLTDLLS
jgi:toxin ParE1/3/4